jgi:hypothetical protein
MKKMLAMILMLGITLPVLAEEVKLSCKYNDERGTVNVIIAFDEKAGTIVINGKTIDTNDDGWMKNNKLSHGYISPEKISISTNLTDVGYDDWTVMRDSGDLSLNKVNDDRRKERHYTGNCAPFKQAF